MVLHVIDQSNLLEEISSIREDEPLKKTYDENGKKKDYEFKTIREFMECHVQHLKRWGGIKFEHKTSITPDELKQIQSFPADFKLCGNTKQKIVQVGNAVPPLVVEKLIKCIIN